MPKNNFMDEEGIFGLQVPENVNPFDRLEIKTPDKRPRFQQEELSKPIEAPPEEIPRRTTKSGLPVATMPEFFLPDGTVDNFSLKTLVGDVGQRLGYTPARDEGALREFGKGFYRGGIQFGQSMAKTFGAGRAVADIDSFLRVNRQLYDSDRKSTWSYIANVAGSQIAENLPMLAVMVTAGAVTGGVGGAAVAGKVGAGRALAIRGSGAAMVGLMQWGNNLEELRERLPDVDESTCIAMNMFLTPLQAWMETAFGVGGRTAKEIARTGLANALARKAGLSSIKEAAGKVGRLTRFRESFFGQWLETGVTETFEELAQNLSMDVLVNINSVSKDWDNQDKWNNLTYKYKQLFKEAFIGGMALGILPATLNSMNNRAINRKFDNIVAPDPNAMNKVDAGGKQAGGVWAIDPKRMEDTFMAFDAFSQVLGLGPLDVDPSKRNPVQTFIINMSYGLASMKMDALKDESQRAAVTPEDFIKELSVIVAHDKKAGARIIRAAEQGVTPMEFAAIVNSIDKESGIKIGNVREMARARLIEQEVEGLEEELAPQLASEEDNEQASAAFKSKGGAQGTVLSLKARAVEGSSIGDPIRRVSSKLINAVANSMGAGFSRVFASGWVRNIKIGQGKPFSIKLDIDETSGELSGTMFSEEEAKVAITAEAKLDTIRKSGASALGDIKTDTSELVAAATLKLNQSMDKVRRIAAFKKATSAVKPAPESVKTAVVPLATEKISDLAPGDLTAKLKFLQDLQNEIGTMDAEALFAKQPDLIAKFRARFPKAVATAAKTVVPEAKAEAALVADNTLAGQLEENEAGILRMIDDVENSEAPDASKEIIRRKLAAYFRSLAPSAITVSFEEEGTGFYNKDNQLMAFFAGSDAGTIVHELVHHLVEQELMPAPLIDALRSNFIVGDDKNRQLNDAEKENISNSFLQFVLEGRLPTDPIVSKAFATMKKIIAQSTRDLGLDLEGKKVFKSQFVSPEGEVKTGGSALKLSKEVSALFQMIFSGITEDSVSKIYGIALRNSLLDGQVSDKYYIDDVKTVKTQLAELATLTQHTPESVAGQILMLYGDNFGHKTDLSKLSPDERYVLSRILEDELVAVDPKRGKPIKDGRIMWEKRGEGAVPLAVHKALRDSTGKVWAARVDEKLHAQIFMRLSKEHPRLILDRGIESGYVDGRGEFSEKWWVEAGKRGVLFERTQRDTSKMERPRLNSFIVSTLFGGEEVGRLAARAYAQSLGYPASISSLTDAQARTLAELKQEELAPSEEAEAVVPPPPETFEMIPELKGAHISPLDEGSLWNRISNKFISISRRIDVALDVRSLVEYLTNNAKGSFKAHITDPLTNIINENERQKVGFYDVFDTALAKHNIDKSVIYDIVKIGDKRFSQSTLLDIYFMSNYGAELDNNSMTKFKESHPEFYPDGNNSLITKIVDAVKADRNLLALGMVMQEMNDLYFDKAATVKETITGEKPVKIGRAYTSERTKGGLFIENEEGDIAKQLEVYVPGLGVVSMEPDALKHRGNVATGEYNLDSFGKFISHIESLINYETKALDIFRMLTALENTDMRSAFQNTYGSDNYRQTLIKLLRREMSSAGTLKSLAGAPLERSVAYLTNKAYTAFLSWNPMTIVTQLTTVFPAISALGVNAAPKFISNFATIMKQAAFTQNMSDTDAYKLVNELSPAVFGELFPGKTRESIKELLEYGQDVRRGFSVKGAKWLVKYEQMGMRPMAASDAMVRLATYQTAYEMKVSEQKYSGKTEQEISDTARHFAEAVIRKSHNPASRSDRGLLQSESSAFLKSTLAFTSQPFAMMKMFITDVYSPLLSAYQKSGLIGMGKELGSNREIWRKIAIGGLLPGVALGFIGRRRPQRNMEELLKDAFFMGLGNLVPVMGQMLWASAILGWGSKGGSFGGIYADFMGNVTDTITGIIGQKPAWDTVKSARRTITLLSGFPDWPVRVLEKLYGNIVIDGGKFNGKTLREATLGRVAP